MQRRVTSRGDIDKWSKLAETSKHWQVFWWPRIRSRDSASFFLVTAMPCIIFQISGVVSDMLYTTWGFPIWNKYHMGSWLCDLCQRDTHTEWQARSVLRPSLKLFSGINFQIVDNCRLIVVFSNTGHYYINSSDCGMLLYYWYSMTCAAMKQMCVNHRYK